MQWALGLAATQPVGLREMFGTMTKAFHPGRAAQNGLFAALLAEAGYDPSEAAIEAKRGFANVASSNPGLDRRPRPRHRERRPHDAPLVLELTGKREPRTGLEGRFSVYHAAACALMRGDGAPTAFADEVVNLPELVDLRRRITATADPAMHSAAVDICLTFNDGSTLDKHVERAVGSREVPLTTEQLEVKFMNQAKLVIGERQSRRLLDVAWQIETGSPAAVARASVPGAEALAAE